jgi:RimJ/RimL family protein N-acetyltransferase
MCIMLCKPKRVKLKDGRTVLLRRPEAKDLRKILKYINAIIDEDAPIELNKRMTLAAERKWMKETLAGMRKGTRHFLLAELDGQLVGEANLTPGRGRSAHVAEYGISVAKDFRRLGVGSVLTKYILDVGRRDKNIKLITLRVYEFNRKAIAMYRKFGFRKVARLPNRVTYKGKLYATFVMDMKR